MSTDIATRHIGQAGLAAIALLAVALLLLPADAEAGQCSRPERVNHRDAECLSASWKNRGLLKKSPYSVSNQCSEYGKVVAKVDLVSARDRTLHLTDSHPRDGDTRHRIRGIYCCSDLSTLCNRSDVESDAGCLRLFERESTAAATCASATATYSSENGTCTISAECRPRDAPGQDMYASRTRITVPATDVDEVHNCNGWLHSEACDFRPLTMSVSDAQVREAPGATLDFVVSLNRTHWQKVRVLYWTSDGTAQRERDYLPRFGYLHFAPGQTERKVSVRVLDDELDEGNETLWLSLSYASPWVSLVDPAAMGTIVNTDPMPRAWIGRFGRTVAEQVLDAVDARMRAEPAPGAEARLGGQSIVAEPAKPGFEERSPLLAQGRSATGRDLLPGTSFALTGETQGGGVLSIWGRGAVTRFAGRDGDLAVDGEVASGLLGADWSRGPWTTGLLLTRSEGEGGYEGVGGGTASAMLTGVWPWVRHAPGERLSLWGVAGYGEGELSLQPEDMIGTRGRAIRTDLDLWMAAAGLRGVVLDGGDDGVTLAVKTDAMTVHTASGAASGTGGNLAAAEADVTRLRLGLEGSRPFRLVDGSVLTPSAEIGLRRDGGDAETGFGADIGAGIAWTDPRRGLGAELRAHGLLAHEANGFRERGLSGEFSWDPVAGERGPRLSLTRTLGRSARGSAGSPLGHGTLPGLGAHETGDDLRHQRLELRFGYGFAAFGDRFTATPEIYVGLSNAGRDYSLGWRLVRDGDAPDGRALELAVEARRHETPADSSIPPEHAIGVRATSRF